MLTACCYRHQDPFEEYKARLARRLAKHAEAQAGPSSEKKVVPKEGDDINWFGVKVGGGNAGKTTAGSGVGKYLNMNKRPLESAAAPANVVTVDDGKKKRKLGFSSELEGW